MKTAREKSEPRPRATMTADAPTTIQPEDAFDGGTAIDDSTAMIARCSGASARCPQRVRALPRRVRALPQRVRALPKHVELRRL
jgi:hypothetical protein